MEKPQWLSEKNFPREVPRALVPCMGKEGVRGGGGEGGEGKSV